jgi:hypothetical protein
VRRPLAVRRYVLRNGTQHTFTFSNVQGPVAVEVRETPTFRPSDYGGTDPRPLGVVVGFTFTPSR